MFNRATLLGILGADVEVRYTQNGTAVANFNIATKEQWTKDGEKQEQTEWHRIVAFGRLGEICGEYLGKGKKVFIEGKIQTRQWEDKEGNKRYTTEINARDMKILDSKNGSTGQGANTGQSAGNSQGYSAPPTPEPALGNDVPFFSNSDELRNFLGATPSTQP